MTPQEEYEMLASKAGMPVLSPQEEYEQLKAKAEQPETDVGMLENIAINLGRQSERMTLGAKDIALGIKNLVTTGTQYGPQRQAIAEYNQQQDQLMAPLYKDRPVSSMVGQAAYFGGIPGAAVATPARAIGTGATTGLLDYESTPAIDASGAAIGYGIGKKLDDSVKYLLNKKPLPAATQDAVSNGFELTPAQRLGNPRSLELMERGLESYLPTSGQMTKHKLNNQDLLNLQFAKEINLPGYKKGQPIDGPAVHDAFINNSKGYVDVLKDRTIQSDEHFTTKLVEIAQRDLDVPIKSPDIRKVVKNVWRGFKDGSISGNSYQRFRSNLVQEAQNVRNSQTKSQPGYAKALTDIVQSLDELAERQIADPRLRKLNREFKMLKTATDGVNSPLDVDTGLLSAPKLRNKLNKKDQYGYKHGQDQSDLYNTVRAIAQNKGSVGSSGTAERMSLQNIIAQTGGIGGYSGYGLASGDITPLLTTVGLPYLLSRGYTSKFNPMGRLNIQTNALPQVGARAGMGLLNDDQMNNLKQIMPKGLFE